MSPKKRVKIIGEIAIDSKRSRQITIKLTDEEYEKLKELTQVFRSPSIVHTVRLVVEDAYHNMKSLLGVEHTT